MTLRLLSRFLKFFEGKESFGLADQYPCGEVYEVATEKPGALSNSGPEDIGSPNKPETPVIVIGPFEIEIAPPLPIDYEKPPEVTISGSLGGDQHEVHDVVYHKDAPKSIHLELPSENLIGHGRPVYDYGYDNDPGQEPVKTKPLFDAADYVYVKAVRVDDHCIKADLNSNGANSDVEFPRTELISIFGQRPLTSRKGPATTIKKQAKSNSKNTPSPQIEFALTWSGEEVQKTKIIFDAIELDLDELNESEMAEILAIAYDLYCKSRTAIEMDLGDRNIDSSDPSSITFAGLYNKLLDEFGEGDLESYQGVADSNEEADEGAMEPSIIENDSGEPISYAQIRIKRVRDDFTIKNIQITFSKNPAPELAMEIISFLVKEKHWPNAGM
jgi:hypothetical protein